MAITNASTDAQLRRVKLRVLQANRREAWSVRTSILRICENGADYDEPKGYWEGARGDAQLGGTGSLTNDGAAKRLRPQSGTESGF